MLRSRLIWRNGLYSDAALEVSESENDMVDWFQQEVAIWESEAVEREALESLNEAEKVVIYVRGKEGA